MLALGAYVLASVAAVSPPPPAHAVDKLASTFDEAACDPADGGECAVEPAMSEPAPPPAILDCESPLIADMIGSCDMPRPTFPTVHVPTLRNGGNVVVIAGGDGGTRLRVVATASSLDAALPWLTPSLAPRAPAAPLACDTDTPRDDAPRTRLDRPPRV